MPLGVSQGTDSFIFREYVCFLFCKCGGRFPVSCVELKVGSFLCLGGKVECCLLKLDVLLFSPRCSNIILLEFFQRDKSHLPLRFRDLCN